MRKALHQKLKDAVTLPYRAQEFLYENLGLQAHADDLDVLMTLARDDKRRGYHDFVRCGVLRALGNHRSEAAYTHLLSVVRQPKSEKAGAFAAAVDGLARSVLWQEDAHTVKYREVVDLLTALVARDEFESVRRAAIAALQRLGAKQSAEVVLASRPMYAEQDWPSLEAAAARLRANGGKGAAVGELTKRVEELETKLRKVEEKLAEPKAESKVESKSNGENGK